MSDFLIDCEFGYVVLMLIQYKHILLKLQLKLFARFHFHVDISTRKNEIFTKNFSSRNSSSKLTCRPLQKFNPGRVCLLIVGLNFQ